MLLVLAASLILTQASPAQAQAPAEPAAASPTSQAAPAPGSRTSTPRRENIVCQNRAATGSVMRRNICRTERRANSERSAARVYMQDMMRGSSTHPVENAGPQ